MSINVIDTYKFDPTGAADNAPMFTALVSDMTERVINKKPLPRCVFPEGVYWYSACPNLAIANLWMEADGYVELHYVGSSDALTFDGGDNGVYNLQFENFHVVPTDAARDTLVLRSIHHSHFKVRCHGAGLPRAGVLNKACSLYWCVGTRFTDYSCSLFDYAQSISGAGAVVSLPTQMFFNCYGLWLDHYTNSKGASLQTTKCTFYNPIIENTVIGIYGKDVGGTTFIDGTVESCTDTAVKIETGGQNKAYGLWLEGNKNWDVWFGSNAKANSFAVEHPSTLKVKNDAPFWAFNTAA